VALATTLVEAGVDGLLRDLAGARAATAPPAQLQTLIALCSATAALIVESALSFAEQHFETKKSIIAA
jgi:hypothetical protein